MPKLAELSHHEQWDAWLNRSPQAESSQITSAILKIAPDRVWGWGHKAYGQRRATEGVIEKAKPLLEQAAKLFPDHDMIQYNLACYRAQLGQLDAAQEHLNKSYELGDAQQIKLMALDDQDLKPLCESE